MTDTQIAWLAGLLEGEGSFNNFKGRPRISLKMTDRDVVERAAEYMRAPSVGSHREAMAKERGWKPQWQLSVQRFDDVRRLHRLLFEHLGARRQEQIAHTMEIWHQTRELRPTNG